MDIFLQQIINGLTLGSVYAVVALGYTMVYGIIQLINFAHGEVVMIGAMVAFSVISALAGTGLPPLVIVLAGALLAIPACMAVGYAMERIAYRPLRRAPRLAPLITAIGISIILQHVAMMIWTPAYLSAPTACSREEPQPQFLPATMMSPRRTLPAKVASRSSSACFAHSLGSVRV